MFNNRARVEVTAKNPEADAADILRKFATRAFRRAVTDDDIKPYLAIVTARLAEKYSFEKAVRVGLKGIMVSPEFLFLTKPGLALFGFQAFLFLRFTGRRGQVMVCLLPR